MRTPAWGLLDLLIAIVQIVSLLVGGRARCTAASRAFTTTAPLVSSLGKTLSRPGGAILCTGEWELRSAGVTMVMAVVVAAEVVMLALALVDSAGGEDADGRCCAFIIAGDRTSSDLTRPSSARRGVFTLSPSGFAPSGWQVRQVRRMDGGQTVLFDK
eukprot:3428403-Pleurochrysis_carterae.AAC.2